MGLPSLVISIESAGLEQLLVESGSLPLNTVSLFIQVFQIPGCSLLPKTERLTNYT